MMPGWAATDILPATTTFVLGVMVVAAALTVWRLVRGPTLSDRVVALDMIGAFVVGAMLTIAIHFDSPVLLQPALALALLGFLGTVAFAQYILKRFFS
jgi:multicomponent Na+:H+ antiporter subunit F